MPPERTLSSPSLPSNAPGTILLETTNLIIRRWDPSLDAPSLAQAANHPSIVLNLRDRFPMPYTLSDAEHYLANYVVSPEGYPSALAILLKPAAAAPNSSDPSAASEQQQQQQPLLIGGAGLEQKGDVYYRTWELGYWFTPSAWGKGYASELVGALVPWAFATWPRLNRIEAMAYDRNEASKAVLKKCGFTLEGVRRGALEKNGEVLDECIWGILRSDVERAERLLKN
ncbi:acyl-CoA N-acyltransferase [Trichoderma longibrachiatum ATCC 18648]|uniref:Acyl-CoA N-acyltransferase n=1 Tax=Trichoderma longibrachiatum ATCC 18648 TaxID=983965 RepID=A0A2T4CA57_TRILO|nr:acyl-CoA N-acyltransferase [Trichoderma longibrachiatum ATCC 18648]